MPRSYQHISNYENEILELKSKGFTVREIGTKLGFTKEQVHNFITRYNSKQRKIKVGIALKTKSRPSKDYEVTEDMKINELKYIPKTILRVMQKYNLLSVVRRKKFKYVSEHLHKYPNLLNREFNAERPNQKWVTDISYIPTAQSNCYLSVIRDLFDNNYRIQNKTKLTLLEKRNQFVA